MAASGDKNIIDALEASHNVGLTKLGKGESFRIRNNRIEVRCRKLVIHLTEVFAAQGGRRIREVDSAIKSAWPSQDCGIKDSGFIGPGNCDYPFAGSNTVQAV